jgi:hypothetical protein
MQALNLPPAQLNVRNLGQHAEVFDVFRNKYVKLTPEEWVRQHVLHYLVNNCGYPKALIAIEKNIDVNGQLRRYDAVIFSRNVVPVMVVECKAPNVTLGQQVLDQIFAYNQNLNVEYLLVSNGMQHYCVKLKDTTWNFLDNIPNYPEITE